MSFEIMEKVPLRSFYPSGHYVHLDKMNANYLICNTIPSFDFAKLDFLTKYEPVLESY